MPRPSVMSEIKKRLEDNSEGIQAAFEGQPEMDREPTLPRPGDLKANVQAIGRAIGLSDGQFHVPPRAGGAGWRCKCRRNRAKAAPDRGAQRR